MPPATMNRSTAAEGRRIATFNFVDIEMVFFKERMTAGPSPLYLLDAGSYRWGEQNPPVVSNQQEASPGGAATLVLAACVGQVETKRRREQKLLLGRRNPFPGARIPAKGKEIPPILFLRFLFVYSPLLQLAFGSYHQPRSRLGWGLDGKERRGFTRLPDRAAARAATAQTGARTRDRAKPGGGGGLGAKDHNGDSSSSCSRCVG